MNMMSIDVTDIQVAWHDAVTVISADPNHKNTIARLAQVAECSIYEVLV